MEKTAKIYVAGHTGMVGSGIVRELKKEGYNNIILKTHSELELCNEDAVSKFFEQERPEYVFLAAAKVGGIKANSEYMADFLIENLSIQENIIKAARRIKVKKLLFLASACIYPKESPQPIKEEYLLTGKPEITNEGYALAKIVGLKMCEYLKRQYGLNYITIMPANAYGINDSFDAEKSHVIPALIKRFHEAKVNNKDKVIMWGSGVAKREFLYVDDLASAAVFAMDNYDGTEFLNVGTGEEISMSELANVIKEVVGYGGRVEYDTSKPDGMLRRIVDSEKIHKMGWKAKTSLRAGIELEYNWFLKNIVEKEVQNVWTS